MTGHVCFAARLRVVGFGARGAWFVVRMRRLDLARKGDGRERPVGDLDLGADPTRNNGVSCASTTSKAEMNRAATHIPIVSSTQLMTV